jgi:hypothetical protein
MRTGSREALQDPRSIGMQEQDTFYCLEFSRAERVHYNLARRGQTFPAPGRSGSAASYSTRPEALVIHHAEELLNGCR